MSIIRGDKMIAGVPIIDGTMSTVSIRPLQNKVITEAINDLNDRVDQLAPGGVYTKSEVNTLLADKADVATTYTKTEVDNIFATLYPIGAIYIGTQSTCPLAGIIAGSTWELVGQDKSLQGSSNSHAANTTINAGLPNITGEVQVVRDAQSDVANGAFYISSNTAKSARNSDAAIFPLLGFSARNSNSIYGNSSTVQPPAYVVNIWRRTA